MSVMDKTPIFFEPSDVWLFRDARPFAAGEQGRATSLFPPTPRTVQGALRSARLGQSGETFDYHHWSEALQAEIGQPHNFGALRLRGPLLARRAPTGQLQRFFPVPQDVTDCKSGWQILTPQSWPEAKANWKANLLPLLPPSGEEPKAFRSGWICEDTLLGYLKGNVCGLHVHRQEKLFVRESRFGVQIDSRPKRPTEGRLYQIEFMRLLEGCGVLVEVSGLALQSSGLLQIGGEARAGSYTTVTTPFDLATDGRVADQPSRFKLYFATPAVFTKGWLPQALDLQADGGYSGNWRGVDVKLLAAAISRAQPIGGRDISQHDQQRVIQRAVPAGSVYHFEISGSGVSGQDLLSAFDGQCVSDVDPEIGFGLCYVGGW
jgi:CRISPR-associated protein Cmr3